MVTTKKALKPAFAVLGGSALLLVLWGCSLSGPQTLLEGEKLLNEKKYSAAIEKIQQATVLLATNAQAWNHLGMAYHGSGQFAQAMKSYQKAISLNRDLMVAHFNLGCLLLELNNPGGAANELRSYILQYPSSITGWIKLGSAQMRLRDLDGAQKSFSEALKLSPDSIEALNGLGVVLVQRGRIRDAPAYFNAALKINPQFPAAIYNLGVVSQSANDRPRATQRYRAYLQLEPNGVAASATSNLLFQWENETYLSRLTTNGVTTHRMVVASVESTNKPTFMTNKLAAVPVPQTNEIKTSPKVPLYTGKNPLPSRREPTNEPVTITTGVLAPDSNKMVQVTNRAETPLEVSTSPPPRLTVRPGSPRNKVTPLPPASPPASTEDVRPATSPGTLSTVTPLPQRQKFPRYKFGSVEKPRDGDRAEAQKHFLVGVGAYQQRRIRDAAEAFEQAAKADPSYFEAQYNLGLAALEAKDVRTSLLAYEKALTLEPDQTMARYNFALALQRGGFVVDAANELETLIKRPSDDMRFHLALANIYAHDLGELQRAREHYSKVLEKDPRHPQATEIRYWLKEHP